MAKTYYLVAGLGKTGRSMANYLKRRGHSFILFDTRKTLDNLKDIQQAFPCVDIFLGDLPESIYDNIHTVLVSPGIDLEEPFMQQARARNIPYYGDIECLAQQITAPVIAVTGTNGKSTVVTLVGEMAKAAGFKAAVAGNIGTPVLDQLDDGHAYDLWVLELSSFQLELTDSLQSKAAAILNISPDHLDRHYNMPAYIQAKQRIYQHAALCVYNRDDEQTLPMIPQKEQSIVSYGLTPPSAKQWGIQQEGQQNYLALGGHRLLNVHELRIKGKHNWQNALAACALADAVGISQMIMCQVLKNFSGLPHRCQWVRSYGEVEWINDSKGTNVGAACSAINGIGDAMRGKIVLIAGGMGKNADFTALQKPVAEYVRFVVLIGQDAELLSEALSQQAPIVRAESMQAAVEKAHALAQPGDVVLLSPACASFDMFRDFNHRGEVFTQLVQQL